MSVVRKSRLLQFFCTYVVELGEYVAMEGVCVFSLVALQCGGGGLGWGDEGKNAELLHMQRGLMMLHEACNDT